MRETMRALRLLGSITLRADRRRALTTLVTVPLQRLSVPVLMLALKLLVDAASSRDARGGFVAAELFAGAIVAAYVLGVWSTKLRIALSERTGALFDRMLADLAAGLHGIEHQERPDYLDRLALIRAGRRRIGQLGPGMLVDVVAVVVQMAGTILLLGSIHPILLVLPAFAIPALACEARAERRMRSGEERGAEDARLADELYEIATGAGPAKELRVFGLGAELRRLHRRSWSRVDAALRDGEVRGGVWSAAGWTIFVAGFAMAVALTSVRAARGEASAGDVLVVLFAAEQLNIDLGGLSMVLRLLASSVGEARRFVWLTDYARSSTVKVPDSPASVPRVLHRGIRMEAVTFAYPGTDRPVLRDVDLDLPAGTTVALVGDNGAGKTTIVKLLCRFYDPGTGTITVDGVDLRRLDPVAWRERTSAAFQDYCRFELEAQRVVGVGDPPRMDDVVAVEGALARAGAHDVAPRLESGLQTQLGLQWEGGVELSTGQWQKLAIARGFMRDDPLLLVLDEPTASLDAATEHALFERFTSVSRTRRGSGGVTVLVSHRFSTVRAADLIYVFDAGRVVESGSHEQLMSRRGLYAELYALQARGYRQ